MDPQNHYWPHSSMSSGGRGRRRGSSNPTARGWQTPKIRYHVTARRSRHPICSSRTETSCSHRPPATNGLRKSGRDRCRDEIAWDRRTGGRRRRSLRPCWAPCAAVSGGGYGCTDRLPVHTRVTMGQATHRPRVTSPGQPAFESNVSQAEAVTPLPSEATSGAVRPATGLTGALLATAFFRCFPK